MINQPQDSKAIDIVNQLSNNLTNGKTAEYKQNVIQLQVLLQTPKFVNPKPICLQTMQVLGSIAAEDMDHVVKRQIASVAGSLMLCVFINCKENNLLTSNEFKDEICKNVEKIRNLMKSTKQQNGLEFELQLIETGSRILSMGINDLKDEVIGFVKNIFTLSEAIVGQDYANIALEGFEIFKKVYRAITTKADEKWYLKAVVIMNSINMAGKNEKCLQNILQTFELEKDGDWHVIYACLEAIFRNLNHSVQKYVDSMLDVLDELSQYGIRWLFDKKESWRIREKVAEICLCYADIAEASTKQKLINTIFKMKTKESNKQVRNTLDNPAYIDKIKDMLKHLWDKSEVKKQLEDELNQQQKTISYLNADIQNKLEEDEPDDQEIAKLKEQLIQVTFDQKTQIEGLQKLQKEIDVIIPCVDSMSKKLDKQLKIMNQFGITLSNVEELLINIQNKFKDKTAEQICQEIRSKQQIEVQNWKNQKLLELYVPTQGTQTQIADIKLSMRQKMKPEIAFDIVNKFNNQNDKKVLLIQGQAGIGKTTFLQHLTTQLVGQSKLIIPIFVHLPSLINPYKSLMQEILREKFKLSDTDVDTLKNSKIQLLLIFDSFDEMNEQKNIFNSNQLDQWNCKVIIACRSQMIEDDADYNYLFCPKKQTNLLQEIVLIPFSLDQMDKYIQNFIGSQKVISDDWNTSQKYITIIKKLNNLQEMIRTPFTLSIIIKELPQVVQARQGSSDLIINNLIQSDLFKAFVDNWIRREQNRLVNHVKNLYQRCIQYCEQLAQHMKKQNQFVVTYPQFNEQDKIWEKFFVSQSEEFYDILKCCPISMFKMFVDFKEATRYQFIDPSLVDYFINVRQNQLESSQQLSPQSNSQKILTSTFSQGHDLKVIQQVHQQKSSIIQLEKLNEKEEQIQQQQFSSQKISTFSQADIQNIIQQPYQLPQEKSSKLKIRQQQQQLQQSVEQLANILKLANLTNKQVTEAQDGQIINNCVIIKNEQHSTSYKNNKEIRFVIAPKLKNISKDQFMDCENLELVFADYVEEIAGVSQDGKALGALWGCLKIKEISFPNLKSIGPNALRDCKSLKSVNFPLLTSVGESAFDTCENLEEIILPNLQQIGDHGFRACKLLKFVNFPLLTSVGKSAFSNCEKLEEIVFPNLQQIGDHGFSECKLLKSVNFPLLTSVGEEGFLECKNLEQIITPNLQEIGERAFMECKSLKSVKFPALTQIGKAAFWDCVNLNEIVFHQLQIVRESAFKDCKSLKSVNFPFVTSVGEGFFYSCDKLEEIVMPNLQKIGDGAFIQCKSLKSANFPLLTSVGEYGFSECENLQQLIAPNLQQIGDRVFKTCKSLKSVNFPLLTSVGQAAFHTCENLEEIVLPKLQQIGDHGFRACKSLKSVNFPLLTSVGKSAFHTCENLEEIVFPKLQKVGEYAFNNCQKINKISCPLNKKQLGIE